MEQRGILSVIVVSILAARVFGAADPSKVEAEKFVAAAVQAEVEGDIFGSFRLLHHALRLDPDNGVARAQLGEVKVDGTWMTAEEAQRRAAADPLQAQYREHRKAVGKGVQYQLTLARWWKRNNVDAEGQAH